MASCARVLSTARRGLRSQIEAPPSTAASPLLLRLLRESEAGVKIALDSVERLAPHRDASFWESLLAALAPSSPRKAQMVLEWKLEKLLKEGVRDQGHYSKLISVCGKLQDIPFAMRVFTLLESGGIRPNTCIFNVLVSACLSAGDVVRALSLFEIMERTEDCKPDLATYNAFVSLYSKFGDGHCMMGWHSAAKKAGLSPNIQTYESLIIGFVNSGKFDDADRFYKEMLSSDILPNTAILECMLKGLCKQKDMSRIDGFLKFVLGGGWQLNEAMAEKLLVLYSERGLVEEMEVLLGSLKPSIGLCVLSQVHCGIIRLYASSDRLDEMEYSIGRMLKGGASFAHPEDVEAAICSYFRQKAYRRLDLFLDRIRGSYKLTRSTYDLLVAGYRRFELNERLGLVIEDMKSAGFA